MSSVTDTKERLAVIETTLQQVLSDVELLTAAVNNLTAVLEQGKGIRWLLGIVATCAVGVAALVVSIKEIFK